MDWTPEEIRRRRDARGLSQEELGRLLGQHLDKPVSRRAINNWENGHATPHGRNLRALDRVLGDTTTPEVTLRDASVMELLAELAGRYASLEATTRDRNQPREPTRYTWYKDDAPTEGGDSPHEHGEATTGL